MPGKHQARKSFHSAIINYQYLVTASLSTNIIKVSKQIVDSKETDFFYYGFQKVTIAPPVIINIPPIITGKEGTALKAIKLMTCQTTNKVAI
jgi:hypothetical protein